MVIDLVFVELEVIIYPVNYILEDMEKMKLGAQATN